MSKTLGIVLCLVAVSLLVGLVGCAGLIPTEDGDGDGPPVVAGTFNCQIDGVALPVQYHWFDQDANGLKIVGFSNDEMRQVWIQVDVPAAVPAVIPLGGPANSNRASYVNNPNPDVDDPDAHYWTDDTHTGTLTINTLTATRCTGTFNFQAWVQATGATVNVTSGTFDVGYADTPW